MQHIVMQLPFPRCCNPNTIGYLYASLTEAPDANAASSAVVANPETVVNQAIDTSPHIVQVGNSPDTAANAVAPPIVVADANTTSSVVVADPEAVVNPAIDTPHHFVEVGNNHTTANAVHSGISGRQRGPLSKVESKINTAQNKKTFATSNYKHFYDRAKRAAFQHNLLHAVDNVVNLFATRINPNLDKDTLEGGVHVFMTDLQDEAFRNDEALRTNVDAVAEYLWTSTKTHDVVKRMELCSILNAVIRDDITKEIEAAVIIFRSINSRRVNRMGDDAHVIDATYPPNGETWRGGSFEVKYTDFFVRLVGKKYRVPGFLATSNKRKIADGFVMRVDKDHPRALWRILFDPRGKHEHEYRVQHMTFVSKTLVKGEHEYLFSPYSVFKLVSVNWSNTLRKAHEFVIEAAIDNREESENLPLTPWY